MPTFDATTAEVLVYSFKEGLLSKMAHDLKIRATAFSIDVEPDKVRATLDAGSLRVVSACKDGKDAPGLLSESDKTKIHTNIADDVLEVRRFPTIQFESTRIERRESSAALEGTLTLHGQSRLISCNVREVAGRWIAEIPLHQPDFGIKPYKAAFGALKIKPDVRISVSVPMH